jgi:hypothetical protein
VDRHVVRDRDRHLCAVEARGVGAHRELVSRERTVGEDVEVEIVACQVSVPAS